MADEYAEINGWNYQKNYKRRV